jgi:hypothetical protein
VKRWQQAGGKLHAVDAPHPPMPGDEFRALCGDRVSPNRDDYDVINRGALRPTCWDCERVWREIEHMEPIDYEVSR